MQRIQKNEDPGDPGINVVLLHTSHVILVVKALNIFKSQFSHVPKRLKAIQHQGGHDGYITYSVYRRNCQRSAWHAGIAGWR